MTDTKPHFTLVNPEDRRPYWVGGQRQAVMVGAADTKGRYALSHSTIAVGGGAAEHAHGREAEAFYVLTGRIRFTIDGAAHMLVPGTFLHLEPGLSYGFEVQAPDTAEVLILYAPAGLEALIETAGIADPQDADASRRAAVQSIDEAAALKAAARAYDVIYVGAE